MKKSILTLAFLLCAVAVFGQNKREVIRLKNGTVVKGAVVGEANDSLAMQTADGSVFFFAVGDIAERTQEASATEAHSIQVQQQRRSPCPYRRKGRHSMFTSSRRSRLRWPAYYPICSPEPDSSITATRRWGGQTWPST